MSHLKTLLKEATYYSFSSLVWRLFNILLLPLYTAVMPSGAGEYGLMTNLYGWGALLSVVLSMGLETTFLRLASDEKSGVNPAHVYSTAYLTIFLLVVTFFSIGAWNAPLIAAAIGYPTHVTEVRLMCGLIAFDTFLVLPYCFLRYQHEVMKYGVFKALYAGLNALFSFYVLFLCPRLTASHPECPLWNFYVEDNILCYVLGCNILTDVIIFYLLIDTWKPFGMFCSSWHQYYRFRYVFDTGIFVRMMRYALPILGASLIDIGIQNLDRILYPWLVPGAEGMRQLSIYGASFRIGMIMALVTQVLRDLSEPALFRLSGSYEAVERTGVIIVRYFLLFSLVVFLGVEAFMPIIRQYLLIDSTYWEGLTIVPILMASEILVGLQFYLSFWYKLTDRPFYGTIFAAATLVVIVCVNIIFVPRLGYVACAWAIFFGCLTRFLLTYIVGIVKSPYHLSIHGYRYLTMAAGVYAAMRLCPTENESMFCLPQVLLFFLFLVVVIYIERRKARQREQLAETMARDSD